MILAILSLAAATPQQAVDKIYAPYRRSHVDVAAWERPIFTPRLRALIARWRSVTPQDEVDDLSDFDWLCQCQDWDSQRFRAQIIGDRPNGSERRSVTVALVAGFRRRETVQLVLRPMENRWLIDDIRASGFKQGLHTALLKTIAADIALRKQK